MMCICGNTLPANAEECPACGGSFNPDSVATRKDASPDPVPEAKPKFDPTITVSVIVFVLAVLIGVAFQSLI